MASELEKLIKAAKANDEGFAGAIGALYGFVSVANEMLDVPTPTDWINLRSARKVALGALQSLEDQSLDNPYGTAGKAVCLSRLADAAEAMRKGLRCDHTAIEEITPNCKCSSCLALAEAERAAGGGK